MRRTKAQQERDGKARLRQRLIDLAQGASGRSPLPQGEEHGGMAAELGIEEFTCWVGAIQQTFGADDNKFDELWMLSKYDNLDNAVEYLWSRGVRP